MSAIKYVFFFTWMASLCAEEIQPEYDDRKVLIYNENIPDFLEHDCNTIKKYTKENIEAEPWWIKGKSVPMRKNIYQKYNHAYGILIAGAAHFTDDSMKRACYLVRYIFAEHEHFRRLAYQQRFYVVGNGGGWCCPPQMGNSGLSCQCNSKFPFLGRGAPAHEMAHYFIKHFLSRLTDAGLFKVPPFVEITNSGWKWEKPTTNGGHVKDCKNIEKESKNKGSFYDFVWNAYQQDKARGTSKIKQCKYHHYFIYSGQQNWLFIGNEEERKTRRPAFKQKSPNLYNLMESLWQCSNDYIPVCKDANFKFDLGLAQKFKIGKAEDKSQPWKMTCREDLDKAEITNPSSIQTPDDDGTDIGKCKKVAREYSKGLASQMGTSALGKNLFKDWLKKDTEMAWYLRRCCYKSANFSED